MANADVPDAQRADWSDLVQGKPELEDSLSMNACQMKAETLQDRIWSLTGFYQCS